MQTKNLKLRHFYIYFLDCENGENKEPMVGLRNLILGSVQGCLGLQDKAKASLRAAISARQDIPDSAMDSHVTAFALYELAQLLIQEAYEVSTFLSSNILLIHSL